MIRDSSFMKFFKYVLCKVKKDLDDRMKVHTAHDIANFLNGMLDVSSKIIICWFFRIGT